MCVWCMCVNVDTYVPSCSCEARFSLCGICSIHLTTHIFSPRLFAMQYWNAEVKRCYHFLYLNKWRDFIYLYIWFWNSYSCTLETTYSLSKFPILAFHYSIKMAFISINIICQETLIMKSHQAYGENNSLIIDKI